jgi:hypothetical protein
MPTLKDFHVGIYVDGRALTEYDDPASGDRESKKVTKYIESVPGARFEVRASYARYFTAAHEKACGFHVRTYIDGIRRRGSVMDSSPIEISHAGAMLNEGTSAYILPFEFAAVRTGKKLA